jgi:NitT/TauT family transport system permease protein
MEHKSLQKDAIVNFLKQLVPFFIFVVVTILILILWEKYVIAIDIPKRILPKPSDIGDFLYKEFFVEHRAGYETILEKTMQSFIDGVFGFCISVLFGSIIGFLIAKDKLVDISLSPILFIIQLLPVPAFAPVIAAIMGYGSETKIFIIVLFTIFPVVITVKDAIQNIPFEYSALFRSYNSSRIRTFFSLTLPAMVPGLLHTMKILTTASIVASIIAELPLTVSTGIGKDIYNSFNNQIIPRVWASLLIISIFSLMFFFFVSYLENLISKNYRYGQFE